MNTLLTDSFVAKLTQLGFSKRTKRVLINYGFTSIEEIRDFINENGFEALRLSKTGFGRIVCEELSRIPFLIQTHEEAKRLIKLAMSLQEEIERTDIIMNHLSTHKDFQTLIEEAKASPEYQKLVERSSI